MGNEVMAWAALAAGAEFMFGYPITPQNEIMHTWSRIAPQYGRKFLQTEDELSAGFAAIGGIMAGVRGFTATAGPGNVLMQEPLSMAEMMRIPLVVLVCQRGGPSTATVVYSQQEVILSCYGGNGEGFRIVYSPSKHQELYDYTLKAFHVAWKYRFPTIVLADGYQGKMRESAVLYDPKVRGLRAEEPRPLVGGTQNRQPAHWRNAYSTEEEHYQVITEMAREYSKMAPEVAEFRERGTDGAEVVIVAHGLVARSAEEAVSVLHQKGIRAGLFQPLTLRPFPGEALRKLIKKSRFLLIAESSYGQLAWLVKRELYGETVPLVTVAKPGMPVYTEEIVSKAEELLSEQARYHHLEREPGHAAPMEARI